MMDQSKNKRQKVQQRSKIDALQGIETSQNQILALENELSCKQRELELEYTKKKEYLYRKREEEIAHVPNFWGEVLMAHPVSEIFTELDQDVLRYLERIEVFDSGVGKQREIDFTIKFQFSSNPYFSNTEIWKNWSMTIPEDRKAVGNEEGELQATEMTTKGSTFIWNNTAEATELKAQIITSDADVEDDTYESETVSIFSMFDPDSNAMFEFAEILRSHIYVDPWSIYNDRIEEAKQSLARCSRES